jgi:predicted PurR-regulated permease PerM
MYQAGLIPFSWIGLVVMLVLVYGLVQQVDNLWLRPHLLGQRLRLHPGLVVVGLIGALALSGLLGALIVVPMIATAKIVGRYIQRKLLGLPPWLPEDGYAPPEQTLAEEKLAPSDDTGAV